MNAQAIESLILIDHQTPRIAADSHGNLITIQQTDCPSSGCVYTVYRYDSHGQLLQALDAANQIVNGGIVFLSVDAADNIYVGAQNPDGAATIVRPGDPPGQAPWIISGAWALHAVAFDPQNNPVVLSSEVSSGHMQVMKLDRASGRMLARFTFSSYWDYPTAVATDSAGAVYIAGSTASPDFPITNGAWPTDCPISNGRYGCQQAFVTKVDPGLQRVVYSSLLPAGAANAIAVTPGGNAYVGGGASFLPFNPATAPAFVVSLNPQGSVVASSNPFSGPGAVADLKLDSSGNVIAIGRTLSGAKCGPDRTNLEQSPPIPFVAKLDSQLAGVSSSAAIPQQGLLGAALLTDGSLYLSAQPLFPGIDSAVTRMVHVNFAEPASPVTCIVNGGNFLAEAAVAPGQLLTILGRDLGPDPGVAFDNTQQLPFAAEGAEVRIGGLAAPLLYVAASQINAIVPYGIKPGVQVPIEIRRNGSVIYTWTVDTIPTNPTALLRLGDDGALIPDDQTKPVVPLANAVNEDGTPNSRQNPAHTGSVVTVYATGYGQMTPALADGAPGATPPASASGSSILSWNGTLPPLSVSTVPGWINSVVAVKFQVPIAGPGIADLVFHLAPQISSQNVPTTFIYVTQ